MYIYFQILTTLNLNVAKLSIHGKVLEKHWARSCYSQPEIGICQTAANEAKYNIEMVKHDQCTLGIHSSREYMDYREASMEGLQFSDYFEHLFCYIV